MTTGTLATPPSTLHRDRELRNRGNERYLRDLLQSVLGGELLRPSERLWLVSPWVSDIPVLDNSTGGFQTLVPTWERASVRLSQVLLHLAERRTELFIALRPDSHNDAFIATIDEARKTLSGRIHLHIADKLHEKGLLGDGYHLKGSFNFTFGGVQINEELAIFTTDPAKVSEARIAFADRWRVGEP